MSLSDMTSSKSLSPSSSTLGKAPSPWYNDNSSAAHKKKSKIIKILNTILKIPKCLKKNDSIRNENITNYIVNND